MPEIAGVRLATGAAGIKYQGRTDVLFALFDKGTSVAQKAAARSKPIMGKTPWAAASAARGIKGSEKVTD